MAASPPDFADSFGARALQGKAPELEGTQTHDNLKAAFSVDTRVAQLYLYFSRIAEIEGYPEVSRAFTELADSQALVTHGHVDFLKRAGDPITDLPMGETELNLKAAAMGAELDAAEKLPDMARTAHAEGFPDIASWFETLSHARRANAERLRAALVHTREDA